MDKVILAPGVYYVGDVENLVNKNLTESILSGASEFTEETPTVDYLMVADFAEGYAFHDTLTTYMVPYRPMTSNTFAIIPDWMIDEEISKTVGFVKKTERIVLTRTTEAHILPLSIQLVNEDAKFFIDGVFNTVN